jgi:hypothetical protein
VGSGESRQVTRETFQSLFATGVQYLGWNDLQVAKYLQVSLPTIGRWLAGDTAPHEIGRDVVIQGLAHRIRDNHLAFCELMLEHGVSTGCPECDYEVKHGEVGPYDYHTCEEDRSNRS